MSTYNRKEIVERLRNEGRDAFLAGKHEQTNPYHHDTMDRYQWLLGYTAAFDVAQKERNAL